MYAQYKRSDPATSSAPKRGKFVEGADRTNHYLLKPSNGSTVILGARIEDHVLRGSQHDTVSLITSSKATVHRESFGAQERVGLEYVCPK